MAVDAVDPFHIPGVKHCQAKVNGQTYHYLLGSSKEDFKATIFLIHGFPDLSIGWRYQIPLLMGMGYRVVCPDLMGFGGTDAPVPLAYYSFTRAVNDIRELARQLGAKQVILGGHDWGGAVVYRVALWFPDFVTHLFSICTPFWAPSKDFVPLEEMVGSRIPNFRYQLQLSSGEIEKEIQSKQQIRQVLNAFYGGQGPNGELGFDVKHGIHLKSLHTLSPTKLLKQDELDYYANQYANNGGLHGPCESPHNADAILAYVAEVNWYRTRALNFQDELLLQKASIDVPVLFISATNDAALPPSMSAGMEKHIPVLVRKEVNTSHWALWEAPEQINDILKEWLEGSVQREKSAL